MKAGIIIIFLALSFLGCQNLSDEEIQNLIKLEVESEVNRQLSEIPVVQGPPGPRGPIGPKGESESDAIINIRYSMSDLENSVLDLEDSVFGLDYSVSGLKNVGKMSARGTG